VIGAFVTLITSPIVFNLLPGTARAVAPLVCSGTFEIVESSRKRGHKYLCNVASDTPDDVTTSATLLTVLLCLVALVLLVHGLRVGWARRGAQ
jgi:hypothetical protein